MNDIAVELANIPNKQKSAVARRPPVRDLRDWLARVERMGELVQVKKPVDRDEEMSAISYLIAKMQPSPAILFDQARGFETSAIKTRMLWNILGPSLKRIALTLEEPIDTPTVELIRRTKDKLKRRIPPREVHRREARVYENSVMGKKIDLSRFPIPKHCRLTADATPAPETQ